MSTHTVFCAGLALVTLTGVSDGQSFDKVRTAIQARLRNEHIPSVAVARKGAIVWEEGFGYADQEKNVPASADTLYSIASLSKTIYCDRSDDPGPS
jgi:CubicO group peptidase (beta-lactamase class C family)